ncbi:MAG: hypothetical protein ABI251_06080 [Mycobacteriaceae bacterium]
MADGPNLRDITKLLDNSGVSDEVKRDLISGYLNQHWDSAEPLRPYTDRLGMPSIGLFPGQFGFPDGDLDKALDQVHKQIDKHDAATGQQALGERSTGAANSNAILDHGAPGLRYFEYFAPLYQTCVASSDISVEKARRLYDEQRDLNFAALRADGDALTKSAAKLAEEITTQRNAWDTIDQLWTGQGAEAANSYVGVYLGQARTAQSQVDTFARMLGPAADALEQAVRDKAKFVADLYADTVGGKSPAQIEEIIYYAQHGHSDLTSLPEAARIVHLFGMSAGPSTGNILSIGISPLFAASGAALNLLEKAKHCATNFVKNVFIPDVEAKWRGLVNVCTATDTCVRQIYRPIVADANSISDHPFTAATDALPPATPPTQAPPAPRPTGQDQTVPAAADQPGGTGAGGVPDQTGGAAPSPPQPRIPQPPATAPQIPSVPVQATLAQPPPFVAPQSGSAAALMPKLSDSIPTAAASLGADAPMPTPGPASQSAVPPYLSGLTDPAAPPSAGKTAGHAPGHGVAWLRDPSTLPPGWTINPSTAELMPSAPGTEAVSPGAAPATPGSVPGGPSPFTGPAAPPGATPPSITISDGHCTLTAAAEADGAQGIEITVTDPAGSVSRYTVEMGENGLPQLTADPSLPADLDVTADSPAPTSGLVDSPVVNGVSADAPVQVRAASAAGWGDAEGSQQMLGLHRDLSPAGPAYSPDDQWLLEGSVGEDDAAWSGLASVLSPGQGRHSGDAGVAAWSDKPEEPAR